VEFKIVVIWLYGGGGGEESIAVNGHIKSFEE
jgi:hypothetical protein